MEILFGQHFDQGYYLDYSLPENQHIFNRQIVGPLGLLNLLERDLGLMGKYLQSLDRRVLYQGMLTSYINEHPGNLFARSFACDPDGVTGELLRYRDQLILAGIKAISGAIVKGPITYAGGSIEGPDQIFSFQGNLRVNNIRSREDISKVLGRVYFGASIWREMCLVGHWIGEAILLRWAELVHEFSAKSIPIATILSQLLKTPEVSRDVAVAKSIYTNLGTLTCVWSNKSLSGTRFDVDHIIPFSLWHNNDLWNLVPSDQMVNNRKRDKIITRETLHNCEDRIVYYWQMQNDANPERFQNEVSRTLLGSQIPRINWEKPTLAALAEAVELVAIQRGVERWSPYSANQ